ncbi:MAG: CoA ester lyase [Chloroflexi bacterium]|nr:CoA ester lyase [Chloroflexota bacterium]
MLLRSLLFVPGNRANMLEKALGLAPGAENRNVSDVPDAFIPDMEDSVPEAEKATAREMVARYLSRLAETGAVVIPRVNSLDSGLIEDDLKAIVGPHIQGLSVGKIGTAADIARVSELLDRLEDATGIERGTVRIVPWMETALAIVNAFDIASSSRVSAVAFGAEDFTNDMEIERTESDAEIAYPRAAVAIAARAAGVLALDTPFFRFRDIDGLRKDALTARGLGFRGKCAIHPAQVAPINEAFSPTEGELQNARRVVEAFEEAERSGSASTSLDGMVIDVPVVRRARSLLDTAARIEGRR